MTKAVKHYLDQHATFESNGASASPDWIKEMRADAIRRFEEQGFPNTKQEAWRFTSVKAITEAGYSLSGQAGAIGAGTLEARSIAGESHRAVIVDGAFSAELSSLDGLPEEVTVCSLAEAIAGGNAIVAEHLGKHLVTDGNPFASLGTAFLRDGVFLHVADGVEVDLPIELLFVTTLEGVAEYPRALLVVGRTSKVQIVENYVASTETEYLRNAATEVVLADGAIAELCRVQSESESAHHVASTVTYQGRDSRLVATYVVLGSRLARHDIRAVLDGEGAECEIRGFYMLEEKQHVDHHTVIDHAKPHCNSKEYLNGVLDDEARAVFTGRIVVREGAQKTDSKQSNNNVLLSETARADSQPQLEIYADDVRCTHGATVGPLSEEATLYFRSRGIAADEARKMLTYGFGTEILDEIGVQATRDKLEQIIRRRLGIEV